MVRVSRWALENRSSAAASGCLLLPAASASELFGQASGGVAGFDRGKGREVSIIFVLRELSAPGTGTQR